MAVKTSFATSIIFLVTGILLGQSGEPILNTTYQSAVNPELKSISHTSHSQFTDLQAKPHSILWLSDMKHATQLSRQTGRPILLHFEQAHCQGSLHANQVTFTHPELIQVIYDHYVPVRINVLAKPSLGKQFKITKTPTDIILDADEEVIYSGITEPNALSYATKLATFATASNKQEASLDIDVGFEVDNVDFSGPPTFNSDVAPANYPQAVQSPANYQNPVGQPQGTYTPRPTTQQPPLPQQGQPLPPSYPQTQKQRPSSLQGKPTQHVQQPPTAGRLQPPMVQIPGNQQNRPTLGLDGYCPVSLSDLNHGGAKWIKGDPNYGIIHRGKLYLFASRQQLDIFKKFPDRLAPVLSGYDPVIFTDRQRLIDGIRELGVSYKGQVYLFSNQQSLQQFWTDPGRYASSTNAAMQRAR